MCCSSFPFSLPPLLLLLILAFRAASVSSVSTNQDARKQQPMERLQEINMDSHEVETLFMIMNTMSSDQNWRESYPNPCAPGSSWLGIECRTGDDNHLHVTRLDFGTPPNPSCKSTATFPPEIFQLQHLESVFFIQCFTGTKTSILFPENDAVLASSSLQQLSLRSNPALIGSIPSQLSSLKSLQVLTLSQNSLDGEIPVEIFNMSSLVHIDLSYNMLTGMIPSQVGNLGDLVGLDLSYNMLTGSIPDTIGQLDMLQKIDLSSNRLTGSIPGTIEKLNSLAFLALSSNKLSGKFPRGLFNLQSLQYFIMDDNPMFISLPMEFGQLQKLQELRLANSGYSGAIPATYSQLNNLSSLSLQNNRLTGAIPASFGSLSHIYHLNLSRNMLVGTVPFNSSFLKRLGKNLDLSGNPGLCMNLSEAHPLDIGVAVCGRTKSSAMIKPWEKSEAHQLATRSFFLSIALCVIALYYLVISF